MTAFHRTVLVACCVWISSCSILNRIDPERAAADRIAKGKWSLAEASIRKAFKKDTLNPEAKFLYARFFLSQENPAFQIDSSYLYTRRTLTALGQSTVRQRERLQKLLVDSTTVLAFRAKVDSAAFERAKLANTEEAYAQFIVRFPTAVQVNTAIELRDELAYVDALRLNRASAFAEYVKKYPSSHRADDARERYELLIFRERTNSGKLADYVTFLRDFPSNSHRGQAETAIFEITTSSGLTADYLDFITRYPTSSVSSRARDVLYFLLRERGVPRPATFDSDSLRRMDARNDGYWVPFYKNGLYGFMNDDGAEVVEAKFHSIDSSYFCGEIKTDFVVTDLGVFSRNGALLIRETPKSTVDLGYGFLKIDKGNCVSIMHQSGFSIGDECSDDAKVVADQFIAVKQKGKWGLYAFNQRMLVAPRYDEVTQVDKVLVLKRYGKSILVKASQLATVHQTPLDESLVFDEVRAWGEGNLWVKNGVLEGVVSQTLEFLIPLDRQVLTKTSFGFTRKKDLKVQAAGLTPQVDSQTFEAIRDYGDWVVLKSNASSRLYRVPQQKLFPNELDSLWIKNKVAFGVSRDSIHVFTGTGKLASFERSAPMNFFRGNDSTVYFWVPEKKNKVVYEASQGKKLFVTEFESIESVAPDLFVFTKKNKKGVLKKGLLRRDGKVVLAAEYDALIPTQNGFLSILQDRKFGLYNFVSARLIKPEYDRNVVPYSDRYLVAHKGGYGFITTKAEPASEFEFDEIQYWNDSTAWVKKDMAWSIYSIKDRRVVMGKVRKFQNISRTSKETIVKVQRENYFGVVSNRRGTVIAPTFTDVVNLGSEEKPFYFTEKRVEEAGIYVVIYYNDRGTLVRKQVLEDAEYDKIYCEN